MPTLTDSFQSLVQTTANSLTGRQSGSLGSTLTSGALSAAIGVAADQPLVRVNRARAAAAVDYGYNRMALWDVWRPWLFTASSVVTAVSCYMLWKRRKVPEAWYTYVTAGGSSAAVAWLTRPNALRGAPAPKPVAMPGEPPSDASSTMQQVLGWIDKKIERNNQTRPGWEAQTWARVAQDLGFGTLKPPASVFFTRRTM